MLGQCIWCAMKDSIVIHRANPSYQTHKHAFPIHYNIYVGIVNTGLILSQKEIWIYCLGWSPPECPKPLAFWLVQTCTALLFTHLPLIPSPSVPLRVLQWWSYLSHHGQLNEEADDTGDGHGDLSLESEAVGGWEEVQDPSYKAFNAHKLVWKGKRSKVLETGELHAKRLKAG